MKADWKARLTSRRTLGRVIRFELLVALIFGIAGLAMLFVPQPESTPGRPVAAGPAALAAKDDRFVYPFPMITPLTGSRANLYEFGAVRRDDVALMELEPEMPEEEPVEVEEVVEVEPPPPPLPDLDGLELIGTLAGSATNLLRWCGTTTSAVRFMLKGDELNGSW